VKFGACLPEAEVICGRGKTCDTAETDSRNNMRMPFGADLTGGNSTVIPFQDKNKIAIGRTNISLAHFDEGNTRRKTILDSKMTTEKVTVAGGCSCRCQLLQMILATGGR
jgi:hypothetical protein